MPLRRLLSTCCLALSCLSAGHAANKPVNVVKTDQPVVALTFDDGPHPANTARMLEIFAREGVKVTFFELGRNVVKHPELARAVIEGGHEIGNHSRTHPKLGDMTNLDVIRAEIVDTQNIVRDATGFTPVVFRAPYISHGPALWTVLNELGLPSIASRLHIADWDAKVTKEMIIERSAKAGPGDILLLHTWPDKTVEAQPEIIRLLREKGLRFVTVSELLALQTPAP